MSPNCATPEAASPVPAESIAAQPSQDQASRLFFDASRGRFVFERGPERLNVLVMPSRAPRVEVERPEVSA